MIRASYYLSAMAKALMDDAELGMMHSGAVLIGGYGQ